MCIVQTGLTFGLVLPVKFLEASLFKPAALLSKGNSLNYSNTKQFADSQYSNDDAINVYKI